MKGFFRSKLFLSLAAMVMALLLTVTISLASPAFAASSEQVVFSGTGSGTFGGTGTQFGFWIWCEATSTNPYQGECNGSMYFYALHITKHVVDGSITELAEGQYQIVVHSTLDNTVSCTLLNTPPPVNGPHNTVTASCTAPQGTGTSTTAVVTVTGP